MNQLEGTSQSEVDSTSHCTRANLLYKFQHRQIQIRGAVNRHYESRSKSDCQPSSRWFLYFSYSDMPECRSTC